MFEKGALKILKEDHKNFQKLLKTLDNSDDRTEQERVRRELATELLIHSKVEEELFYPALEKSQDKNEVKSVQRAYEEHDLAEKALKDVLAETCGTTAFTAKVEVLRGLVVAHAKEEEMGLFSIAKKTMDNDELETLGNRIEARKETLRTEVGQEVVQHTR